MIYDFKNNYIKNNFENKKEYYYLGFQSVDFYITKIIYNYLSKCNREIEFCCDFTLVQKIVKRICSKEYFKNVINKEEKYIYSYIGAVICDDTREIQRVIEQLYNIEDFLLQIYKKENNIYNFVKKYLDKNNYKLNTDYIFANDVTCSVRIEELNIIFTNSKDTMLEAKYAVIEEIRQYIIENKLHFDAKEVITNYDITNSYNVLENLYDDKYINKPNYFILEHDQFDEKKYEIRCSVEGYNFYSVKIHSDKEVAKNLAAYSMLEMIVLQSN